MIYVRLEPAATRLGNWMFQYAAAKTSEPESEVVFVVPEAQMRWAPAVEKYRALFGGARVEREEGVGERCRADALRVGLYQDAKWVDRALCRKLFLGPLEKCLNSTVRLSPLPSPSPLVSIHVRRGDYMALPHRHPFVGKQYLKDAVAKFPGAEFLVFSDDMAWCKRFFGSFKPQTLNRKHQTSPFHFAEGNDVLTDLYLMTQCRGGHICSNSTFSWWGAYLGDDKARTVFPSMWYGPSVRGVDWKGLYFPGSEVVENGYTLGLWLRACAMMAKEWAGRVWRKRRRRRR